MTMRAEDGGRGLGRWWRVLVWGGAAALLLTPAVAMRFTDEVAWNSADFVIFGLMLAVPLGVLELAVRATGSVAYRSGAAVALGAAFLITWINLAVGILGDEGDPLNLMFFGVIALGIVGAFVARFRPRGLAVAMVVTAAAQSATAVVAVIEGQIAYGLIGFFVALWLLSAWLFRAAAEQPAL